VEAEEVDPLDAFMAAEVLPEVQKLEEKEAAGQGKGEEEARGKQEEEREPADGADLLPPLRAVKKEEEENEKSSVGQKVAGRGGLLPKKTGGMAFGMLCPQGGMQMGKFGAAAANGVAGVKAAAKKGAPQLGRILPGEESGEEGSSDESDAEARGSDDEEDMLKTLKRASKVEKMGVVDHSKIAYPPFRKDFYIEVKEVARMSPAEVAAYRRELGDIKIRGKDVPKPVKAWTQTGLSSKVLDTIRRAGWEKPMPIQAQALPVIMSGRDFIGIAKTGSGKTLAFVLPMLRHILDQPPLQQGDGPIAIVMAPTRELVQQIHSDVRRFTRTLGLTAVAVYGGSGVADQIGALKRGAEIVVCTPGRMIDILCTGKVTNLRRVTYFVMDEADRMFDMGFEPQITRIIGNTRPDRQTVLFSATFPRSVEALARKVLGARAVEVQIGGRSVVNRDIAQSVELRPEEQRFPRLLELLGEWYERGKILVFVHSQEKADAVFRELLKAGYPCLSLHGGKDQEDRESTLADFKADVCSLLVATSVAARGLDVKDLQLVVNMDVPNHYEDYVHRVGRTGRAGNKGTAITFISEEEDRYAPDLVKALQLSEQAVPADLKALADGFLGKVKAGTEQTHGSGFGGSGFKFDVEEEEARKSVRKEQAREYGFEEEKSDSDGEDEDEGVIRKSGTLDDATARARQLAESAKAAEGAPVAGPSAEALAAAASNPALAMAIATAQAKAAQIAAQHGLPVGQQPAQTLQQLTANLMANATDEASRAAAAQAAINLQETLAKIQAQVGGADTYEAEVEINDFPQHARWKATHKENLGQISDFTGVAITTRGQYFPPGKQPGPADRKLYLFIEGPTESSVKKARQEIRKLLEAAVAGQSAQPIQPGKYFL
jgi:ATP-dependent RNA helicase DDX46/PRP5